MFNLSHRINYLKKIVGLNLSIFSKRKENIMIFGSWYGQKFADNPKYLYLYCIRHKLNAIWITKNIDIYNDLKGKNMPVLMAFDREGKKACKSAKYVFVCTGIYDVNEKCVGGANIIEMTHGLPLKKYLYDDLINGKCYTTSFKIDHFLTRRALKNTYVISSSPIITQIFLSAFHTDDKHILELGMPRNDCFFDGTFQNKRYSRVSYKKLVAYLPTHRDEGKNVINIPEILDLQDINQFCVDNDVLFVIKKHFYHKKEVTDLSQYSNIIDYTNIECDTQELLYNSDVLITDYSSCYIDYLLLDRPIIFYAFDYDDYRSKDRDLYFNYEEIAPGEIVKYKKDLICSLKNALNNHVGENHYRTKNVFYSKCNQGIVSDRYIKEILKL